MSDKKTAGRHAKAPHDRLSDYITVSLTPRTYQSLKARAERMNLPMTWVARSIILTALEEADNE